MSKRLWILLGACVLCAPLAAQSPSYTFVEGGFWRADPEGAGSEDGWFLGGMAGLGGFQIFVEFADAGNIEQWQVGGGWHGLLGERADLVAQGQFIDTEFGGDGLGVSLGVRWMVLQRLELNGFVNYTRVDFSDTSFEINGIWNFAGRFGVGAGYDAGDELSTARAFVRFNFGRR